MYRRKGKPLAKTPEGRDRTKQISSFVPIFSTMSTKDFREVVGDKGLWDGLLPKVYLYYGLLLRSALHDTLGL
jgi:hypothetical protein